jgi:lipopolysaccharide transport system permease protein
MVLFTYVFPARFGEGVSISDYSVNVLAGIVPWLAFQDILACSPLIIISHASLVKQIAFPTEVLPIKTALASVMPYTVGLVFALGYAWWHGALSMMVITIPLLIIFQLMAMIGTAFLLAAGGVFMRDLREVVIVMSANLTVWGIV